MQFGTRTFRSLILPIFQSDNVCVCLIKNKVRIGWRCQDFVGEIVDVVIYKHSQRFSWCA